MIFTNQFHTVVDSLSVFGEEIVIEPLEGAAKVSCGSASVNVPFAPDAASIKKPDMKDALILQFKKADFLNAVYQGAYAQEEGNLPSLSKTCYIKPCIDGEGKRTVKFSSTTSFIYAESDCDVAIQEKSVGLFEAWTQKGIIIKSPALTSVARSLSGETLLVYLTDKQAMIAAGSEVYNFVAVEGSFMNLQSVIQKRENKDFEMKLDKNKIKSAFKVTGLYSESGDDQMTADVSIEEMEGGKVKVTVMDKNNKNHVQFEAEGFGNQNLRLNKAQVTRALDCTAGDDVSIYGETGGSIIFISGSNDRAFSFNITANAKKPSK
jgi:hypothetical protein